MSKDPIRKKITVECYEHLPVYGGIRGPIRTPYYETLETIAKLIMDGATVYEWIKGEKIKLDLSNFDRDNVALMKPQIAKPTPEKPPIDASFEMQKAVNQNKPLTYPNATTDNEKKQKIKRPIVDVEVKKSEPKATVKADVFEEE